MIKIEFPADRPDIALAMAKALHRIGKEGGATSQADDLAEETTPVKSTVAESTESPQAETEAENTGTAQAAKTDSKDHSTSDAPASLFDRAPAVEIPDDVDTNGVAFNAELCGKAKEPFYGSGKRKGQWKKRKGVDDAAYDAWYAGELGNGSTGTTASLSAGAQPAIGAATTLTTSESASVNTGAAFGTAETQATPTTEGVPTDCGTFMGWVSAKQAAGLLTQEEIGAAYSQAGVQVTSLFPPNDAQTVAGHIAAVHGILAPIAASRSGQ